MLEPLFRFPFAVVMIGVFAVQSSAWSATMSKKDATERLRKHGIQWQQTEIMKLEADAKSQAAHSYLYPQINIVSRQYITRTSALRYGLLDTLPPDFIHVGSSSLEVFYLLFDSAARERIRGSDENQQMTKHQIHLHQNDLLALLLTSYAKAQWSALRVQRQVENRRRADAVLKAARAKRASGLGLKLDVMRAEALVASESLKAHLAESAERESRMALFNVLGGALADEASLPPLDFVPLPRGQFQSQAVLEASPDRLMAVHMVKAAEHLKEAARRDGFPRVALAGDVGFIGTHTVLGFGSGALNGSVAMQVSIPLYTGGKITSKESEEGARLLQAELHLKQVEIEKRSRIEVILEQLKSAETATDVAKKAWSTTQEELRLAERRWQEGQVSLIDWSQTLNVVANAHDQWADALLAWEGAKIQYCRLISDFEPCLAESEGNQ